MLAANRTLHQFPNTKTRGAPCAPLVVNRTSTATPELAASGIAHRTCNSWSFLLRDSYSATNGQWLAAGADLQQQQPQSTGSAGVLVAITGISSGLNIAGTQKCVGCSSWTTIVKDSSRS